MKLCGQIDGILFDLGVSSPQLDDASRGFSFLRDGPLDMRMNRNEGISAADWLASASEAKIAEVLWRYGDEIHSKKIAKAIITHRANIHSLRTTSSLSKLIKSSVRSYQKGKHPATKTFQAIRIVINHEIKDLEAALESLPNILSAGGRAVVISFHSIEHRIVKKFIKRYTAGNENTDLLSSVQTQRKKPLFKRIGRSEASSSTEVAKNVRSRSAWIRVLEKLAC